MKKTISKVALVLIVVLTAILCLYACNNNADKGFTVTVMDGEEELAKLTIAEGKLIDLTVDELKKPGFELIGLYTDAELNTPFAEDTAVADDLVLYAKFSKKANFISVNSDGGSKVEKVEVVFGEQYNVPEPQKEGYRFVRYVRYNYTTEEYEEFPKQGTYNLPGDALIKAEWQINTYTVIFYDGTEKLEEKTVNYKDRLTLKSATQKAGSSFVGWFEQGATEKFADNTEITKNVNLYAVYSANTYTISIVENGGDDVADVTATYGAAFPTLPTMNRGGYEFAGWQKDGVAFTADENYNFAGGITLVAQWTANTYTIVIDENGGNNVADVTATYGAAFPTLPTVVRGGYHMTGWKLNNEAFTPGTKYLLTNGITLVAQWEANEYTLNVYGWDEATITVTYGQTYTLVNPADTTNTLYVAKIGDDENHEWSSFEGYTYNDEPFAYTGTYNYAESITVYPVKTDNVHFAKYKVTFHYGTSSKTVYIAMDATDKTIQSGDYPVAAAGYTLGAWHVDALDGAAYVAGDVTADLNLYATYTANTYQITIVENGGDDVADAEATFGEAFPVLPTMTRNGYTFAGWKKGGATYTVPANYTETTDITLVAQWTPETYTINFDANEGSISVSSTSVTYDAAYDLTGFVPARTGYTFQGWKRNGQAFSATGTYTITDNIVLVADWSENSYVITYKNDTVNGETFATQTVGYEEVYSLIEFIRFGYDFVRLTDVNGNEIVDMTNLTHLSENVTYIIIWSEREIAGQNYIENGDDLILFTGITYQWSGKDLSGGDAYWSKTNYDTITPTSAGTFTMTLTPVHMTDNGIAPTGDPATMKNVKVVYSLSSMLPGTDYKAMEASSAQEGVFMTANSKESYVMEVGASNFVPDVVLRSDAYQSLSLEAAEVKITAIEGEDTDRSTWVTFSGNAITFDSAAIGKTLALTITPKYSIYSKPFKATLKVKVNDGVNVYTSEDLKAAYGDGSVTTINILRNIKAKLAASDYIPGYGESYGNVTVFTDKDDVAGTTTVIPNVNLGAPINDFNHGVYTRVTTNQSDNVVINGNYFVIDGSGLPYINNSVDRYGASGSSLTSGAGYRIANTQIGLFLYRCADVEPTTAGTIRAYNGGAATMNNLRIEGNNIYDQVALQDLNDGDNRHLLKMSASYIGVIVRGGKMNMNNVSIRNTEMGFMLAGAVSGYDEPGVIDGVQGQPQPGEEQATQLYANGMIIDHSWANSIYAWDLCIVNLKNSKIGQSSGAAIHVDDRAYGGTGKNKTGLGYSDLQTELVMDIYTAAHINNWVSGDEAWFTAYGRGSDAMMIKQAVESVVAGNSSNTMTILKRITINGTQTTFMNFAVMIYEAGNGWKDADRLNDTQQGCSAKRQTYLYNGSELFYGDNTELPSVGSGRPYAYASTSMLPGGDGTPNGMIKLLLPIYTVAEVA